jgi:CTP:molybdopterin cytidylyltransferase MocA
MPGERVAGILLAAGAATRFGADKLSADVGGRTLLQRSAAEMLAAGLDPVLVVVRPGAAPPLPSQVTTVANTRWREGISASIQAGVTALADAPSIRAAVLAPADQPWCRSDVYRRLIDALRASGRDVIVAAFDGAMRNPVLLARAQWSLADEIDGDVGLSAVVRTMSPLTVECSDIGSVDDIDTPADLVRARRTAVDPFDGPGADMVAR